MIERLPRPGRPSTVARLLVFSVALAAALAAALGAQQPAPTPAPDPGAAPAAGTPRLVVEENHHNYGRVIQGELVQHEYIVRNDGDGPLLIKNVQAT